MHPGSEFDRKPAIVPTSSAAPAGRRQPKKGTEEDTKPLLPPKHDPASHRLQVIQTGFRTVVGFKGGDLPPEHFVGQYLAELQELIEDHGCRDLRFDLSGLSMVPSGFLGILKTLGNRGVHTSVCHASATVREVFELANFAHCLRSQHVPGEIATEKRPTTMTVDAPRAAETVSNAATATTTAIPKAEWMGSLFTVERAANAIIVGIRSNNSYSLTQLQAEAQAIAHKLEDPSIRHLVIDLNGVSYVSSEVIGIVVSLGNTIKKAGGKAAVCRVSMHMRDMLLSIGLLRAWPQCPTREAAVIAVNRP